MQGGDVVDFIFVDMKVAVDDFYFFFSSRRRHTRCSRDWSSDVCSSDLLRPLAYFAEDAVVVYPQAAGTPLSDYARRRVDEVAPWFERAGAVLRNLHQMPVELLGPLGPPHEFSAEIRGNAKKSEHILALVSEVASAIEALLNSARELAERLPQEPPTFTHGDLKSEHIWVAPGRITLMDFDTSHLADPALDLGR